MKVNFIIMPSLEEMSLHRIAIALWSEDDIKSISSVALSSDSDSKLEFHNAVDIVRDKVSNLSLPEKLKSVLRQRVRQIGVQLCTWMVYHLTLTNYGQIPPTTFHWTSQGAVDNIAMVEMLVKDATIHVVHRYKIACAYFLIEDIKALYELMSDTSKERVKYAGSPKFTVMKIWAARLVSVECFTVSIGSNFRQHPFLVAAMWGNISATHYFLRQLSPVEKEELSFKAVEAITRKNYYCWQHKEIPDSYNADVLCLLLSTISEAQQTQLFKDGACQILICLIDWAWDVFFMELMERFHRFLHPNDYYQLLKEIKSKIVDSYKDQSYCELFIDVLQRVPVAHKVHVIEMCMDDCPWFLTVEEIATTILSEASEQKKVNIFQSNGLGICEILVCKNLWGPLELFIQSCVVSKETMIDFTHCSRDYVSRMYPNEHIKWRKFFQICEESIQNFENRKDEDQPQRKLRTA